MGNKKHPIWKAAAVLTTAILTVEAFNRIMFHVIGDKNPLSCEGGEFHSWKHGDFFYKKLSGGSGHPILILHDLYPDKSADQCEGLAHQLAEHRTVYTMDLLGCGRSAKPAITYSNFLYVLQVTECVEKIIGQPVHLVAQGRSAAIAVAAANYKPEYYSQLTLLDPAEEEEGKKIPDRKSRLRKKMIELPVLGTFAYHMVFGRNTAAHMGGVTARYLYGSIVGRYTNYDVGWMLQKMEIPVHVVQTEE